MSELIFTLPDVGEGLADAEIIEWLVAVGDHVRADQPVVTIETAKAQVELPAPADGTLRSIAADAGEVVPVGEPLFVLDTAELDTAESSTTEPDTGGPGTAEPGPGEFREAAPLRRVLAAPSTRRLGVELGVDLARITGTGPNGRITDADVRAAAEPEVPEQDSTPVATSSAAVSGPQPAGAGTPIPLRGLRRQIARAMDAAWKVPHVTEFRQVDATALEAALAALRAAHPDPDVRLTPLPLLVRAVLVALRRHPALNATLDMVAEQYILHPHHHVGLAVATGEGLMVPVLRDAARYSIEGLARQIVQLAAGARARSLTVEQTSGATITISNFGSYGTWLGTPLITPPQVAIVGFGRIAEAVVPVDGVPAVRRVLPIAVSADHRLLDGDALGEFVTTLERLIAAPLALLGES
ncbi:dihydrolipoamide acetyltransferase family protein [Nocardia sp. Marseille-Q1738]